MSDKKKQSNYSKILSTPISRALWGLAMLGTLFMVMIANAANEPEQEGWYDMKTELRAAVINGMANLYLGVCIASAGAFVAAGAAAGRIKEETEEN